MTHTDPADNADAFEPAPQEAGPGGPAAAVSGSRRSRSERLRSSPAATAASLPLRQRLSRHDSSCSASSSAATTGRAGPPASPPPGSAPAPRRGAPCSARGGGSQPRAQRFNKFSFKEQTRRAFIHGC